MRNQALTSRREISAGQLLNLLMAEVQRGEGGHDSPGIRRAWSERPSLVGWWPRIRIGRTGAGCEIGPPPWPAVLPRGCDLAGQAAGRPGLRFPRLPKRRFRRGRGGDWKLRAQP